MAGIDNNTVLYLRGDSFKDLSSFAKNVVNSGAIIDNNGKFGKQITVNNPSGRVDISDKGILPETDDFTIEFWCRYDAGINGSLFRLNCAKDSKNFNFCSVGIACHSNYYKWHISNNHTSWANENNICNITPNTDIYIAVVRQGTTLNFFENGLLRATTSIPQNILIGDSNLICLNETSSNISVSSLRISNVARYTEDFTPPTKPYNSITINKTNQTDTNIEFNIEKLGQETINKVEVLVNGVLSETYTDSFDNVNHTIDKSLIGIGNNDITIRVTYDDNYVEEEVVTHTVTVNNLPTSSSLKDVIDRQELLNNSIEVQKNNLKNILVGKNVEVAEEDKMSDLIEKVDLLGEYDDGKLWLYKEGDECSSVTGGWIKGHVYNTTSTTNFVKNADNITLTSSSNTRVTCLTSNLINVKGYSKLNVEVMVTSKGTSCIRVAVSTNKNTNCENTSGDIAKSATWQENMTLNSRKVISLDISNANTSCYIGIANQSNSGTLKFNIFNVWLEK